MVGRPEKPVPFPDSDLGRLALYLRRCRNRAGLTYAVLAACTQYSATTLQRAAGGERLPPLKVVLAYEAGCGRDRNQARELWDRARRAEAGRGRSRAVPLLPGKPPRPDLIVDRAELSWALVDLHERSAVSYREMELRVEGHPELRPLSRSTAHRIIRRQAFPTSQRQLMAMLHACAVPERNWDDWVRAWQKVRRSQDRKRETGTSARRLAAREAEGELTRHELEAVEPFRSATAAWSVRCRPCGALFRVRLTALNAGWPGCPSGCSAAAPTTPP